MAIIQDPKTLAVEIKRCQVRITIKIVNCGTDALYSRLWNSEIVPSWNDRQIYLSKRNCQLAFKERKFKIDNRNARFGSKVGNDLMVHFSPENPSGGFYLYGKTEISKNWCIGDSFTISNIYFANHLLWFGYTVDLEEFTGTYFYNQNSLLVKDFKTDKISKGYSKSLKHGVFIYNLTKPNREYSLISKGIGLRYQNINTNQTDIIIINSTDRTLSILVLNKVNLNIDGNWYFA